jgi:hypothetical protein
MLFELRLHFVSSFGSLRPLVSCRYSNADPPSDVFKWTITASFTFGCPLETRT